MLKKLVLVGLIGCFAGVQAQVTRSGSLYSFAARYRKGQSIHYLSVTTIRSLQLKNKQFPKISRTLSMHVLSVSRGIATIRVSQGNAMLFEDKVQAPMKVDVQLNSRNRAKEGAQDAGLFSTIQYPAHPIHLGDKWKGYTTITFQGASSGAGVATLYRFQGFKNVSGKRVAALSVELRGFAEGEGNIEIDPRNGFLVRSEVHMTLKTTEGPIPVDVSIKQVP